MNSPIVDFYLNGAGDFKGRTFDDLIARPDASLEKSHDIVQWLFPLNEYSAHSRHAPVLTAEDIEALATPEGQAQYRRAFDRFMSFYGMKIVDPSSIRKVNNFGWLAPDWNTPIADMLDQPGDPEPYDNFSEKADNWIKPQFGKAPNHNLKRITRIIRCAKLLKLDVIATKTFNGFSDLARTLPMEYRIHLTDKTLQFWSDAVNLPLTEALQVLPPAKKVFRS